MKHDIFTTAIFLNISSCLGVRYGATRGILTTLLIIAIIDIMVQLYKIKKEQTEE